MLVTNRACCEWWHLSNSSSLQSIQRNVIRVILAVVVARAWSDLGVSVLVPIAMGQQLFATPDCMHALVWVLIVLSAGSLMLYKLTDSIGALALLLPPIIGMCAGGSLVPMALSCRTELLIAAFGVTPDQEGVWSALFISLLLTVACGSLFAVLLVCKHRLDAAKREALRAELGAELRASIRDSSHQSGSARGSGSARKSAVVDLVEDVGGVVVAEDSDDDGDDGGDDETAEARRVAAVPPSPRMLVRRQASRKSFGGLGASLGLGQRLRQQLSLETTSFSMGMLEILSNFLAVANAALCNAVTLEHIPWLQTSFLELYLEKPPAVEAAAATATAAAQLAAQAAEQAAGLRNCTSSGAATVALLAASAGCPAALQCALEASEGSSAQLAASLAATARVQRLLPDPTALALMWALSSQLLLIELLVAMERRLLHKAAPVVQLHGAPPRTRSGGRSAAAAPTQPSMVDASTGAPSSNAPGRASDAPPDATAEGASLPLDLRRRPSRASTAPSSPPFSPPFSPQESLASLRLLREDVDPGQHLDGGSPRAAHPRHGSGSWQAAAHGHAGGSGGASPTSAPDAAAHVAHAAHAGRLVASHEASLEASLDAVADRLIDALSHKVLATTLGGFVTKLAAFYIGFSHLNWITILSTSLGGGEVLRAALITAFVVAYISFDRPIQVSPSDSFRFLLMTSECISFDRPVPFRGWARSRATRTPGRATRARRRAPTGRCSSMPWACPSAGRGTQYSSTSSSPSVRQSQSCRGSPRARPPPSPKPSSSALSSRTLCSPRPPSAGCTSYSQSRRRARRPLPTPHPPWTLATLTAA